MKIGIISDSHSKVGKTKKALDMLIENGAEFIIHAGDIGKVETLELLKNCGKQYVAVYGNNDAHLASYHNDYNLVQEPYYFKLANLKFKLMHLPFYMNADADIIISGHTHIFNSEFKKPTLFLNPGEVCARNKPVSECAMLKITDDKYKVIHYTRADKEEEFQKEKFTYERN